MVMTPLKAGQTPTDRVDRLMAVHHSWNLLRFGCCQCQLTGFRDPYPRHLGCPIFVLEGLLSGHHEVHRVQVRSGLEAGMFSAARIASVQPSG